MLDYKGKTKAKNEKFQIIILLTLKIECCFRINAKLVPNLFRCVKLSIKTRSESSWRNTL